MGWSAEMWRVEVVHSIETEGLGAVDMHHLIKQPATEHRCLHPACLAFVASKAFFMQ
jgi:hypothetical protein